VKITNFTGVFKRTATINIYTGGFLQKAITVNNFMKLEIGLKNSIFFLSEEAHTRQPHTALSVFLREIHAYATPGIKLSTSSLSRYTRYHYTPESPMTKQQKYSLHTNFNRFGN
jgi:hypothetical protein